MIANCEQVLLKGTLGELVLQNIDQLCSTQSLIMILGRVLSQFQAR